jgi:hypothetical protein
MPLMRYAVPRGEAARVAQGLRQAGYNARVPPPMADGVTEVYIEDVSLEYQSAVHDLIRHLEPRSNPLLS